MNPLDIAKTVFNLLPTVATSVAGFVANPVAGTVAAMVSALAPVVTSLLDIIHQAQTSYPEAWATLSPQVQQSVADFDARVAKIKAAQEAANPPAA